MKGSLELQSHLLTRVLLAAVTVWGAAGIAFMSQRYAGEMKLFTDPRYELFWDDVLAFHLKLPTRKTPVQLSQEYGMGPVMKYVMDPNLAAAYLPSERASFVGAVTYSLSKPHPLFLLPVTCGMMLIFGYLPMIIAARQLQRLLTWLVCRHQTAREIRAAYFCTIGRPRYWAIATAFAFTTALSLGNALQHMSPEVRRQGVTTFEVTGWLVTTAYFAGFWIQLLIFAFDTGLLAVGFNPHHSLWSELFALAVTVPVLAAIYKNSWLTLLAIASAALAVGLVEKWTVRGREPEIREDPDLMVA